MADNKTSFSIATIAVKRPIATSMVFIALSLLGAVSYYLLPVELVPNMVFPHLYIVLFSPSASPEEMEQEMVIPAEGAIAALEGIESIDSSVYPERADILVSFDFGTDMRYAYLKLEQRMSVLRKQFPEQSFVYVQRFDARDFTSILMQLVVGGSGDPDRLRNLADDKIIPRIESVDGVVDVRASGGKEYAVEVIVDEDRCEALQIPLPMVTQKIVAFNRRTEYLGDIEDGGKKHFVSLIGRLTSIGDVREIPVSTDGRILLKDVAEVRLGRKDQDRISRINGNPAVMLLVRKDDAANLLRVAKSLHRELRLLNVELADRGVHISTAFDAADKVSYSIHRVQKLALFGVAMALGVLLIFLKRLRTVSIILLAIPVSLLITFNVFYFIGVTINLLSLLGFAFAIGLLVDNGVVVIENTFRHATLAKDGITAAIRATNEVTMPIIAMTCTTLIVFLPVFFLIENEFRLIMEEFVYSIAPPLLVSVFVSLTLIPMLAARTIDRRKASERKHNRMLEIYVVSLKAVLRHRLLTMVLTILFFFFTLIVCLTIILMRYDFLEPVDSFEAQIRFPKGTSIETASRLTAKLEDLCKELPDVKEIHANIEPESAQVNVEFAELKNRTTELDIGALKMQIRNRTNTMDGLEDRVWFSGGRDAIPDDIARESMAVFGGSGNREYIKVRGEDSETLEKIALQIEQLLRLNMGYQIRYVHSYTEPGAPELQIRGKRDVLSRWGITMQSLAGIVWFARRRGEELTVPYRTKDEDIDILVRIEGGKERTIEDLEQMKVLTPDGRFVEMAELAEFKLAETSKQIRRRDQQHEVQLAYAFRGDIARSASRLQMLQKNVDDIIGTIRLPRGYTLNIVHKEEEDHSMRWAVIAAAACVFLLLAALFEDIGTPLCVMATLPLAMTGVLWGFMVTDTAVNFMVMAGLVMLVGIAVNDAILTLGQARNLMSKGYPQNRAMLQAGRNRLRPVMMTTATTMLALLPLAIRKGGENEIWPPFAVTVIFGLGASTFFTLVFVPAMYMSLNDIGRWLKSIHIGGLAVAGAATAALYYFGFIRANWVERWQWRMVLAPSFYFIVAGVVWAFLKVVKTVTHVSIFEGEDVHISIRNLTKIYGSDRHVVRDWKKKRRREATMRKQGVPVVNKTHVREDLIWKIPLLGLMGYFHSYFELPFWVFVNGCVTWALVYDLVCSFGKLCEGDNFYNIDASPSTWRRTFWGMAVRLPTFGLAAYIYYRVNAQSWLVVVFLVFAMLLHSLNELASKARRGEVDISKMGGIWGRLKRLALRIPIVAGVKQEVEALYGVDLEIGKGMFGLLGPNGAGKTTLMRILCNIYEPTRGCVKINGRKIRDYRADVQPIIGYLPQHFGLYGNFSMWDYLEYFALLNGIYEKEERHGLIDRVLAEVHLEDRKHDKISSLSGGMRQRVGIAQTLLHLPKIIVVDEPTAGLDPMERIRFRNLLAELSKDRIVLFSTHITEDISSTCNDVAVLDHGRLIFRGPPEDLQRIAQGRVREALVDEDLLRELKERTHIVTQVREADGVRVRFIVREEGKEVGEEVPPTLEDAYLWLLRTAQEPA